MLETDKSRGDCLEMICADFPAGANLDNGDPTALLQSMSRFFRFLPGEQWQTFLHEVTEKASRTEFCPNNRASGLIPNIMTSSENRFCNAMAEDAKSVVPKQNLQVHHKQPRSPRLALLSECPVSTGRW